MTTPVLYLCYIPSPEFCVFCFVFLAFNFRFLFVVLSFWLFVIVFVLLTSFTLKLRLHLTHYILPMYSRSTRGRTRSRPSNDPFLYR